MAQMQTRVFVVVLLLAALMRGHPNTQQRPKRQDDDDVPEHCRPNSTHPVRVTVKVWSKKHITWNIGESRTISHADAMRAMNYSAKQWSEACDLTFSYSSESDNADIRAAFSPLHARAMGDADCCEDGYCTMNFNDVFTWFYSEYDIHRDGVWTHNLVFPALHEFGHCLGMYHSCNKSATMYPNLRERFFLTEEDINRVERVYGASGNNEHVNADPSAYKDPLYFYNEYSSSFMSPPDCKCAALRANAEDSKPWELIIINRETWTYQIYSTGLENNLCLGATDDGLTTMVDCGTNDDHQIWLGSGGNGYYSTYQNVATLQYLSVRCEDANICTRFSNSGGNEYDLWLLEKDKTNVPKPA